jgi:hypothetical protein
MIWYANLRKILGGFVSLITPIQGSILSIIQNHEGTYEGNLESYHRAVFHGKHVWNPYHNYRHICHVTWLCYQACQYYAGRWSRLEKRCLLIAALFHDFNHTGKPVSDSVNIQLAKASLKKHLLPEDRRDFGFILKLIDGTEYPHKVPSDECTLAGKVLRDADLCQALDVAWVQQVAFGLSAERGITPREALLMQDRFLSNISFETEWAKERFPKHAIESKIAEANGLAKSVE